MTERKTHIVGLSGGKDSCAAAIRLKELNPLTKYVYICTPTGDELPEMEDHWNRLEDILNQPIIRVHHPDYKNFYELIEEMQMLPNFQKRWCTVILKLEAIKYFYDLVKPAIVYIGLRADEGTREGYKLLDKDIKQKYPMQEWGWNKEDVWRYLDKKKITIPRRTDCGMCFYQRLDEWYSLWEQYPERFKEYEDLEFYIGHSLLTEGKFPGWGHWLFELRCDFGKGRMPRAVKKVKKQQKEWVLFKDKSKPFDYSQNRCRVCSL